MFNEKNSLESQIIVELTPIRITSYAFEKANYISRRICKLADRPLEVGFYLLDDSLEGRKADIVIRDVYIGQEQTVMNLHCNITALGKINSYREIKNIGKKIVGWGHSHANIGTFYSGEDDRTILKLVKQWGIIKELNLAIDLLQEKDNSLRYISNDKEKKLEFILNGKKIFMQASMFDDHSDNYLKKQTFTLFTEEDIEVPFFYGMTFNAANDEPYCIVAYMYGDKVYKRGGLNYEIVESREAKTLDKKLIDDQLISRVIELREKYSNFEGELENDFELLKRDYMVVIKAINFLTNDDKKDRKKEENQLNYIHDAVIRGMDIIRKYNPESRIVFTPNENKLNEFYPKMNSFLNELIKKLCVNRPTFEKRLEELTKESNEMSIFRPRLKKNIIDMRSIYSCLIETIENYNLSDGGSKYDRERQ